MECCMEALEAFEAFEARMGSRSDEEGGGGRKWRTWSAAASSAPDTNASHILIFGWYGVATMTSTHSPPPWILIDR